MDSLITYNEAAEFLKYPTSLSPRPGFANMRALRQHMVTALTPKVQYTDGQEWSFLQWCMLCSNPSLSRFQETLAQWQYICYRPYAHKIYPRIVIPIGAFFSNPHMRSWPK